MLLVSWGPFFCLLFGLFVPGLLPGLGAPVAAVLLPSAPVLPSPAGAFSWSGGCGFLRPSRRSLSGWVAVLVWLPGGGLSARGAWLGASSSASALARVLPPVCGGVVVRRCGRGWAVSVPVVVG